MYQRRQLFRLAFGVMWLTGWTALAQRALAQIPPSTSAAPAAGTPRLELSPTDFDFGEVWQGAGAKGEITIRNAGTADLSLDTKSSCGCTLVTKPQSPLAPGAVTSFTINYDTAHAGPTLKTVTVFANDPDRPRVIINVHGQVKPLFATSPGERLFFYNLETDSVRTQSLRLESLYDAPLNLKLQDGLKLGPFTAELTEIQPGKVYELKVTTKPPLRPNANLARVILETGVPAVPTYSVLLNAHVPARVTVVPPHLNVTPSATQTTEQVVEVRSRGSTPLRITDVKCSLPSVTWVLLPAGMPAAGEKSQPQRLRLTLPPFDELSADGATVQIFTDDPDEQFRKLELRIYKVAAPTSAPGQP